MQSFLLYSLITIMLLSHLISCNRQTEMGEKKKIDNKKDTLTKKRSYRFKYHSSESLIINLELDTLNSETKVIGLKLSNGQELNLPSDYVRFLNQFQLEMLDLNFDGYKDIWVLNEGDATGNSWYDTWIYNKPKKQWLRNAFLSKACDLSLDTVNKKIITSYWGGWADQSLSVYTVSDTTFRIVEEWYVEGRTDTSIIFVNHIKNRRLVKRDSIRSNLSLFAMYKRKNGLN